MPVDCGPEGRKEVSTMRCHCGAAAADTNMAGFRVIVSTISLTRFLDKWNRYLVIVFRNILIINILGVNDGI